MGWTFTHRERGLSTQDYLAESLIPDAKIVASASHWNACHLAIETAGGVHAAVVLTRWARDDWHNFGTKWIDESMGPNEITCPDWIIDLLSPVAQLYPNNPTAQQYAAEWRNECRARARRREHAASVRPGDLLRFAKPIRFTTGLVADKLVFISRSLFHLPDMPHYRVRLTGWRDRSDWTASGEYREQQVAKAITSVLAGVI